MLPFSNGSFFYESFVTTLNPGCKQKEGAWEGTFFYI